jgi:hypothetical protein
MRLVEDCDDYAAKPISVPILLDKIANLLT